MTLIERLSAERQKLLSRSVCVQGYINSRARRFEEKGWPVDNFLKNELPAARTQLAALNKAIIDIDAKIATYKLQEGEFTKLVKRRAVWWVRNLASPEANALARHEVFRGLSDALNGGESVSKLAKIVNWTPQLLEYRVKRFRREKARPEKMYDGHKHRGDVTSEIKDFIDKPAAMDARLHRAVCVVSVLSQFSTLNSRT
ncbi:hypothetical protein MPC4_80169 [Methylocella tundrae]|uniref:Uncharacterized protein n=1 Tax=Methylocella tundrae TaxID=227605 RepID=A0A8B6MD82_METTU|nr:hypothetical protein [Methylocella tundrae]VTZ27892.1 hypothetical protein MPC1_70002 [Methylocella tundrae]VTZ52498.1 hypothetical protein MPC4_80169 [Methylocella tundrae]